jgi:hypothetical protein
MNEEQVAEITRLQEELASAKASHLGSGCNWCLIMLRYKNQCFSAFSVFDRPDSQSSFYRFLFNDANKIEDVSYSSIAQLSLKDLGVHL